MMEVVIAVNKLPTPAMGQGRQDGCLLMMARDWEVRVDIRARGGESARARARAVLVAVGWEAAIAREGGVAAGQPGSGVAIRPQASRSINCQPRERGSGLRGFA